MNKIYFLTKLALLAQSKCDKSISTCTTINRALFASSNVVAMNLTNESNNKDINHFLYSNNKCVPEELIDKNIIMQCKWYIVCPCYVWGQWCDTPFKDLFLSIEHGF